VSQQRVERRLAAILAADVAGYSRLMGADEAGTARRLREHREAVRPIVTERGGRIVKTTGDGLLLEFPSVVFPSVVAAVECAVAMQTLMAERNAGVGEDERMLFRMGVNLGDVLIEGDDILGDGVNIAARLESIAEPGGVCLSGSAFDQVRGKVDAGFVDLGEVQLKNIARPVRIYQLQVDGTAARGSVTLALPDKPSIAVLAFENLSGDPEQEYFADGMVDDIITALSRYRWLFVIARNSSFTYKGRAVDVKQVGRELGVRYVLEGSVRKAASRVRITGQLIDASTGAHLWADRFEGALDDIFELQDQMTASVISAIAQRLEQVEIERARRKPRTNLDAYDCYLRGVASIFAPASVEAANTALTLSYRAIELDPEFASAYGLAAFCYFIRKLLGWMTDPPQETAETARLARRAAELGGDDAAALTWAGYALIYVVGDLDSAAAMIDRALVLNSNLANAWHASGLIMAWRGEPESAVQHIGRAIRLSPLDPFVVNTYGSMAFAHFLAGHYDDARSWAERAVRKRPQAVNWRFLAASCALSGRIDEAQRAMAQMRRDNPTLRVSDLKNLPFRRPDDLARYEEALRRAGLPE
jgi:TolB-like protein